MFWFFFSSLKVISVNIFVVDSSCMPDYRALEKYIFKTSTYLSLLEKCTLRLCGGSRTISRGCHGCPQLVLCPHPAFPSFFTPMFGKHTRGLKSYAINLLSSWMHYSFPRDLTKNHLQKPRLPVPPDMVFNLWDCKIGEICFHWA